MSENAEYDAAKNEQGIIEGRIAELEAKIRTAKIIKETDDGSDKVRLGSKVILEDAETGTASITPSSVRQKPIRSTAAFPMNLL